MTRAQRQSGVMLIEAMIGILIFAIGILALQNPPPFPPNIPNADKVMKGAMDTLKSIKLEAKGSGVTGGMAVSKESMTAYMGMSLAVVNEFQAVAPPLPPPMVDPAPKEAPKKEETLPAPRAPGGTARTSAARRPRIAGFMKDMAP